MPEDCNELLPCSMHEMPSLPKGDTRSLLHPRGGWKEVLEELCPPKIWMLEG